jgi:hypothetical protein
MFYGMGLGCRLVIRRMGACKEFVTHSLRLQRDRLQKIWFHTLQLIQRRIAMSLSSHLSELKKKHQHLSDAVEDAQRAPGVDGLQIADLKKQKLRLKEEIERLTA